MPIASLDIQLAIALAHIQAEVLEKVPALRQRRNEQCVMIDRMHATRRDVHDRFPRLVVVEASATRLLRFLPGLRPHRPLG
ncbi:hypothetical protein D3C80_1951300 [compost metagenome]